MPEDKKDKLEIEPKEEKKPKELVEEAPVVVQQRWEGPGEPFGYTTTSGRMPLRNEDDEIEAQMFYTAYTRDGAKPGERPLMFSFNGGPGSPSLWLHLGALGPKRVAMDPQGELPKPPYKLIDNPHSWLPETDLVFIDPIGTGFSRPKTKEIGEKHWGLKGDIESVGEFIRLYLTRNSRWLSPLYLVGESYGTTRAAGLSGHLIDLGIAFNGIVLVSSILNFQTARFFKGNDLPYVLFLPTYVATAWYHGRLDAELSADLQKTLREAEAFAAGEYTLALGKGDALVGEEREAVVRKVALLTGLSPDYVDRRDLRLGIHAFCKELLRDQKRTVGRLDSRFKGIDGSQTAENPEHDPSMSALMPPYVSTYLTYARETLGYQSDLPYEVFRGVKSPWNWGAPGEGPPDTSEAMRSAMSKNPHMKVFVASGYYDFATPYYATEYTLAHTGLDAAVRGNVRTRYYDAGHMMYIHEPCLSELHSDVVDFLNWTRS